MSPRRLPSARTKASQNRLRQHQSETPKIPAMVTLALDADPALGFVGVLSLRQAADALEAHQVRRARDAGWTWAEIGGALGVSAQAAHKKHGRNARV